MFQRLFSVCFIALLIIHESKCSDYDEESSQITTTTVASFSDVNELTDQALKNHKPALQLVNVIKASTDGDKILDVSAKVNFPLVRHVFVFNVKCIDKVAAKLLKEPACVWNEWCRLWSFQINP